MTSEVTQAALEPCPFCGGEAERFTLPEDEFGNGGGDVITCSRCQASSHVEFGRKENLVDRWNTRLTAQSGEGRSGAGEDAVSQADLDHALKWISHNMMLATGLMKTSSKAGNGVENFRAHDAYRALKVAKAALNARQSGEGEREALRREIINTPETADFMAGVPIEAAHQRERWGADHDAGKTPFDWFWLIGYLAQKAATSAVNGNIDKALHHTISTAAALANWHAALSGADTAMRPGIAPPASLDEAALRATDDAGGAK